MPPGEKKLSAEEKATIAAWIDQGAKATRPEPEALRRAGLHRRGAGVLVVPAGPPARVPEVEHPGSVRTPDRRLPPGQARSQAGCVLPRGRPADLDPPGHVRPSGLPPTPEEIEAFLADRRPTPTSGSIDRLLASPHYGERWARHWLDVAGYADSDGDTARDTVRPYAYKYRDYLVRSLNADRPWDELIREQLAGDEMVAAALQNLTPDGPRAAVATGFLRMAPDGTAEPGVDQIQAAQRRRRRDDQDRLHVAARPDGRLRPVPCPSLRPDPAGGLLPLPRPLRAGLRPAHWRTPAQRLVSLWTDRRTAAGPRRSTPRSEAIERERQARSRPSSSRVFEKELAEAPEGAPPEAPRGRARPRRRSGPPSRSDLLKAYPRTLVTAGNVSLYDPEAHPKIIGERSPGGSPRCSRSGPAEDFAPCPDRDARASSPTTRLFYRGDPDQPRQEVAPGELSVLTAGGRAGLPADDPRQCPTSGRRARVCPPSDGREAPAGPPRPGQPRLDEPFRQGARRDPGRLRRARREAVPSRAARLAGRRLRPEWLALKHLHRLIMTSTAYRQVVAPRPRPRRDRSRQSPARPDVGASARGRGGARRDAGRERQARPDDVRPPRAGRAGRGGAGAHRHGHARRGRPARPARRARSAMSNSAAASTSRSAGRCRSVSPNRSTSPR